MESPQWTFLDPLHLAHCPSLSHCQINSDWFIWAAQTKCYYRVWIQEDFRN